MPIATELLQHPGIWRVGDLPRRTASGIGTGHAALDHALADSGWPPDALSELLTCDTGVGEFSLVMPALRSICAAGRYVGMVAPPHLPHARALESAGIPLHRALIIDADGLDAPWAAEQLLRTAGCGIVVLWTTHLTRAVTHRALQRLQLAAGAGHTACLIYRHLSVQAMPSPASLRLLLSSNDGQLRIEILKRRGALRGESIDLCPFPAHWRQAASGKESRIVSMRPHATQPSAA